MYKLLWSLGSAGTEILLKIIRNTDEIDITVKSDSRYSFMDKRKKH
jgi:hypothetical protein